MGGKNRRPVCGYGTIGGGATRKNTGNRGKKEFRKTGGGLDEKWIQNKGTEKKKKR